MPVPAMQLFGAPPYCAVMGSGEMLVAGGGALLLGWLAWQLHRSQRTFALELAEQASATADEAEKARLAQAENQLLQRENKAKSEMIATLSREIRGHLNGIVGAADLLLDHSMKPPQRDHLATLRASAQSLHQSLNDVLDYSSLETGQIQIAHAPFDLRQPVAEVVETLTPLALLKGLELVLILAPDVPTHVVGDMGRLRQSLLNLLSNAVKFTTQGRVVLRVTVASNARVDERPGVVTLQFSILDTGARIPEETHATLFDRGGSKSARNFGSSGLELAISKRLVELMGGQIGARSLPEGGSEFWIELAMPAEKDSASAGSLNTAGIHVVVLDRHAASRVAMAAMLARLGFDQDATDSVDQAAVLLRDAVEEEARRIVLLVDDSMAAARAVELAALVREPALRDTRIVLMARDADAEAMHAHSFPVDAVVRKPVVRPEVLAEAVRAERVSGAPVIVSSRPPFEGSVGTKVAARRGVHVLVVDDDNISRSVTLQLLEILGCAVDVAVSGPEAIERARQAPFELIFMDCQMPVMDGFEATRKILAEAKRGAAPIVALTASTSDADRQRCFAAGMSDFIAKPVRKADLARVLKQWVRSNASRS